MSPKTLLKSKKIISAKLAVIVIIFTSFMASGAYFSWYNLTLPLPSGSCGDGQCSLIEKAYPSICPRDCSLTRPLNVFVAIHMEPGNDSLFYLQKNWPILIGLVESADKYNIKLTLQFTPQWAMFILKDPNKLNRLRNWEVNGHEIALHHHGPSHNYWDGYTNRTDLINDPRYKGNIDKMMSLVRQLPVDGNIMTGGVTDEDTDWPKGVPYDTNGGPNKSDLLSVPTAKTWNGIDVTSLKYRMYAVAIRDSATLNEVEAGYSASRDQIMGIIFHVHDYEPRKLQIDKLFESLSRNNVSVRTVSDILSSNIPKS